MAEYDDGTSIPTLIRGLLDDARDLVRGELQLARAEIREELSAAQTAAIAFAIAGAIAYFLHWPTWAGYALTAVLFFACGWGLSLYARGRLKAMRGITETKDTMKENLAWMQKKSGLR